MTALAEMFGPVESVILQSDSDIRGSSMTDFCLCIHPGGTRPGNTGEWQFNIQQDAENQKLV